MAAEDAKSKFMTLEDYAEEEKVLKKFPFYHGYLPREDLHKLLFKEGDYLLRMSEVEDKETENKVSKREIILSIHIGQEQANSSNGGQSMREEISMRRDVKEGKKKPIQVRNVVVHRVGSKYFVEKDNKFDTLTEFHQYYTCHYGILKDKARFTFRNGIELQKWEFTHSVILLDKLLGEGAFGEVRQGVLTKKSGRKVDVAVKLMKGTGNVMHKEKIKEMMNEARLMRNFKHKNVVRIFGVAVDEQPIYIILELVKGGSLHSYLKKNTTTTKEKMAMCHGAALGVEYMHNNTCIHRDLAARNCLYTDDKIVKISDFGLSKNSLSHQIKTPTKLPIKWLAPDTIKTLWFSTKSDVYSYGIIVFEIFADGAEPWSEFSNAEVKKMLREDVFLTLPESCPEKLRNFIKERVFCVDTKRASMTEVVQFLNSVQLTETNTDKSSVDNPKSTKSNFGDAFNSTRNQKSAYLSTFSTLENSARKKKKGFHHKKHNPDSKRCASARLTPSQEKMD